MGVASDLGIPASRVSALARVNQWCASSRPLLADGIWGAGRALYRRFRTYPARTHGRTIRVFLLTTPTSQS